MNQSATPNWLQENEGDVAASGTATIDGLEDSESGNNEDNDGNAGIYGRAPWGTLFELLTYPGGIDLPTASPAPRWTPHP